MIAYKTCVALLVVFACAQVALSLKCYTCKKPLDTTDLCNEESKWDNTTVCASGEVCFSARFTDSNDTTLHVRKCGKDTVCDEPLKLVDGLTGFKDTDDHSCDTCEEDFCNSAYSMATSLLLPIVSFFVIYKLAL